MIVAKKEEKRRKRERIHLFVHTHQKKKIKYTRKYIGFYYEVCRTASEATQIGDAKRTLGMRHSGNSCFSHAHGQRLEGALSVLPEEPQSPDAH